MSPGCIIEILEDSLCCLPSSVMFKAMADRGDEELHDIGEHRSNKAIFEMAGNHFPWNPSSAINKKKRHV